MAKYTIHHTCGHETVRQLYGPHTERERLVRRLESQECEQCRRDRLSSEAAAANSRRGLVPLEGSQRQIAWAEGIRKKAYDALETLEPIVRSDQARRAVDNWRRCLDSRTDASWWIDNRDRLPSGDDPKAVIWSLSRLFS